MGPPTPPTDGRAEAEAEAATAIFTGSLEESIARGREDVRAGRVYSSEAVARWRANWGTSLDKDRPDADWHSLPR